MRISGIAIVIAAVGLVAGCSSTGSDSAIAGSSSKAAAVSVSAEPETGLLLTGKGYSVRVPDGWEDWTKQANTPGALPALPDGGYDLYALDRMTTANPTQSISLYFDTIPAELDTEAKALDELEKMHRAQNDGTEVLARAKVDGAAAVHVAKKREGVTAHQFWIYRDKTIMPVVAITVFNNVPQEQQDKVISDLLSTWKWTTT